MYDWAMFIWGMSGSDFVWSFLKWFAVLYIFRQIHNEIAYFRMKRVTRLSTLRR